MHRHRTRLAAGLALAVVLVACDSGDWDGASSGGSTTAAPPPPDAALVVDVLDNEFAPAAAEVGVGETVTWDFSTAEQPHNVVFEGGDASEILDGGSWSTSFDAPGTYPYECTLHRGMTGQLTVVEG